MYKIDYLVKTFLEHAETAEENKIKDRKAFKKMNPKEPLPDWMNEEDYDDYDPCDDEEPEEEGCSCGYYCFDCLGMSWSDFM